MTGSDFKHTQFVFHEVKQAKPPVRSFKYGQSTSLSQHVNLQPQLTSVRSSCCDECQIALATHNCPGLAYERALLLLQQSSVPRWVVLWSLGCSERLATTQDKHKQRHPLGRLTPRASVGACQPGLWPGGAGTVPEHPSRHPESTGSPQWKDCISLHGEHWG